MKFQLRQCLPQLVVLAIVFTGCRRDFFNKTIELDGRSYDKQIVLNCFLHQEDTLMRVSVTQNFGLTETVKEQDFYLSNANLSWKDGDGVTTNDFSYSGKDQYTKNTLPKLEPGKTYTLQVAAPGLPTATVRQTMPTAIQIDTVLFIPDGGVGQFGDDVSRVEVVFQDPPGVENFYAVSVSLIRQYESPIIDPNTGQIIGTVITSSESVAYAEPPLDPSAEEGIGNGIIMNDELFDGKAYRLRYNFSNSSSFSPFPVKVRVRFRHINKDEYLYRITERKREESEEFPLVEPVIVHSNVQDGIGIFSLSWSKTFVVEE